MVEISISCLHTCVRVIKYIFVKIFIKFCPRKIWLKDNTPKATSLLQLFIFFVGGPRNPFMVGGHPLQYPPPLVSSVLAGVPPPTVILLDPPLTLVTRLGKRSMWIYCNQANPTFLPPINFIGKFTFFFQTVVTLGASLAITVQFCHLTDWVTKDVYKNYGNDNVQQLKVTRRKKRNNDEK